MSLVQVSLGYSYDQRACNTRPLWTWCSRWKRRAERTVLTAENVARLRDTTS